MREIELKNIGIEEFKEKIYFHYVNIFPEEERKPLILIELSYKKQYTKIIEILYQNKIAGFMLLNRITNKGYLVLDYLVILPEYRNKGIGTKALKILLQQEKETSGIFIEIEKTGRGKDEKENLLREKRKKFYENLGFKKLNFDLLLFGVIYMPYLFSNIEKDEDTIIDEILSIYKVISGKERIKQNCKIVKNEDLNK